MNGCEERTHDLIKTHLSAVVPLLIIEVAKKGGPTEEDYARVRQSAFYLGEHGDALLFGGKHCGTAMDKLAEGIAVLAFCPGGVACFGCHFDASKEAVKTVNGNNFYENQ